MTPEALDPQSWQQAISGLLAEHGITAVLLLVVIFQGFIILKLIARRKAD